MIKTDEIIIKIVSNLDEMYGSKVDLYKTKEMLEMILFDYDIVDNEKALVPINNDIAEKIYIFLASKKIDGLSDISLESYSRHLKRFADSMNKNINDIDAMDIRIYLANYARTGVKINSIVTEQSILRSFFGWLEVQRYISNNPMKLIKAMKAEKNVRKPFSKEEIEKLIDSAETPRQQALFLLFYASGCRLKEIEKLNKVDIDWYNKSFFCKGKGNKERKVYFSARAKVALKNYLDSRNDDCEALFVTTKKEVHRLGERSIQREIEKIGKLAGINKDVFVHRLRHSYACHLLGSGVDINVVKELLGHSSLAVTEIYAKTSNQEVEYQYKKYSL